MRKHKLQLLNMLSTCLIAMPVVATISCLPKNRPLWNSNIDDKNKIYSENHWNAHFDYPPKINNGNGEGVEGDYNNTFNISKDELIKIRDETKLELTDEGKNFTNNVMYEKIQEIFAKELLGNGVYHKPGRKSFEELFAENDFLKKMFSATFANLSNILQTKYQSNKWEVRYEIFARFNEPDVLWYSFQFFRTDKNHIDRNINEGIINAHDVGVGVGPKFIKRIIGFKKE